MALNLKDTQNVIIIVNCKFKLKKCKITTNKSLSHKTTCGGSRYTSIFLQFILFEKLFFYCVGKVIYCRACKTTKA